ncbi:hypothetical protein RFUL19S_04759 [Rhizobacter fulvus]
MLTLQLVCRDARRGTVRTLRGLIASSANHGEVSDYWVSLLDFRHRPLHRALLRGYPRWAETTRAFLARCLDAVLVTSDDSAWFPTDSCELTVTEWSTQSVVDLVSFGDLRRATPVARTASVRGRSGWQLVRWICAQEAFGRQELPEPPMPVKPTIYERSGVKYCRTSELPIEARVTFEQLQNRLDRPFVPAVPDAVYPWWLDCFLRGELPRHEFPRELRLTWG